MKRRFGKYIRQPEHKRKITISDGLAIIGLILTIVFGYWGIQLSKLSIKQGNEIANQQTQIKGFDSLLKLTKSEITILVKQDSILNSQLLISNNFLEYQKSNIKLSYKSGLANLMNTENELKILVWQPHSHSSTLVEWSDTEREIFISLAKPLLEKEINNTFLIQNTKLYSKWVAAYDSLTKYKFNKQFVPEKEEDFSKWYKSYTVSEAAKNKEENDKLWRSAFISVSELWQQLYNFLTRYKSGRYDFDK